MPSAIVTHQVDNIIDALNTGAIEIAVVFTSLDEQVGLHVTLHLVDERHKMIISTIYFVGLLRPGRIYVDRRLCPKDQREEQKEEENASGIQATTYVEHRWRTARDSRR